MYSSIEEDEKPDNFRRPLGRRRVKIGNSDSRSNSSKNRVSEIQMEIEEIRGLKRELEKTQLEDEMRRKDKHDGGIDGLNFGNGGRVMRKIWQQDDYNFERNRILHDDDFPHIECLQAIVILIVNFLIPGLGTMIIGFMSTNCSKFFWLGVRQFIVGFIIGFVIEFITGIIFGFTKGVLDYFLFSNILIYLLAGLWPLETSIRLYKLSH
jgi:hypothetical protein